VEQPFVSVILTNHAGGDFLKDSINSILEQTFQNFELIIINNSLKTQKIKEILGFFKDNRIKWVFQETININEAKNCGIKRSKGKYIAFIESDDLWEAEKLEKQVYILEKRADIALVYCGSSLLDQNNNVISKNHALSHKGNVFKHLVVQNFLYSPSTIIFRKNCLDKVGLFDESLPKMTDWEFYLRFSLIYKFWGIKEYLVKCRIYPKTKAETYEFFEDSGFKILNKIFQRSNIEIKRLRLINSAYAMRYRYVGKKYYENKLFKKAKNFFYEAIKRDFFACCKNDTLILYLLSSFRENLIHLPEDA